VTDLAGDSDTTKNTRIVAEDLAQASGLARAGASAGHTCDRWQVQKPPTPVDFIMVMDESGSMSDNRRDIAYSADRYFKRAVAAGLDFRVGVTNVCTPTGPYKAAVGKFCSKISTDATDMGGTDRFLVPTEKAIFSSCVLNPPGYEGGAEFGLTNVEAAVKNHLPRAANRPDRIRPGAKLVVIVATDEVPNSLNSILPPDASVCGLNSTTQATLDAALKPLVSYLKGTTDPGARVDYFQVIGGVCHNNCDAMMSHGYRELADVFNGRVYDICSEKASANLDRIVDSIVTSISSHQLSGHAIAASLNLALEGKPLKRSWVQGFNYSSTTRRVGFYPAQDVKKGSSVVASYRRWQ
jgi:hypothetical protein